MSKLIWQAGCFMGSPLVPATSMTEVTVINAETGNPAQLWEDRAGNTSKSNPFTIQSLGLIRFYVDAGRYSVTAVNGNDTQTWPDVIVIDPDAGGDAAQFSEIVTVTGSTRTLTPEDAGKWLNCTNSVGCEITIPVLSIPVGAEVYGEGVLDNVTFVTDGSTLRVPDGFLAEAVRNRPWALKLTATNTWVLVGFLEEDEA
jgi:hypothetical protein